jgi:hypothetical protein
MIAYVRVQRVQVQRKDVLRVQLVACCHPLLHEQLGTGQQSFHRLESRVPSGGRLILRRQLLSQLLPVLHDLVSVLAIPQIPQPVVAAVEHVVVLVCSEQEFLEAFWTFVVTVHLEAQLHLRVLANKDQ